MGLGASFSGASSPANGGGPLTNGGTGLGSSVGFATQPTGLPAVNGINGTGSGGFTALGAGSYLGVGLRPQATGVGLGAANPFRASMMTPNAGSSGGAFPAFANANGNSSNSPFLSPTGAPSFGQSLFLGAQTDASKQFNSAAPLI